MVAIGWPTGMEFGDVFHYSLNCREQMKGVVKDGDVIYIDRCLGHEVSQAIFSDFTIP